ncbi:MAG: DUF2244 domain-containing protein [Alphaproteobacteria bacterium]|nr:DUF2244 domain-containing protein [Alphaproteobacteria bacterium]
MTNERSATAPCGPADERVFFDATLRPNRSLGRFGFRVLMTLAGGSVMAIGVIFMIAGAWPVLGFGGLEFLLLFVAFRLNYRAGRAYERVRLTERHLEVRRFGAAGEVGQWRFEPTWVRVNVDAPADHDCRLTLSSHGNALVIGAFLSPGERFEVAEALRAAIDSWRTRWSPSIAG